MFEGYRLKNITKEYYIEEKSHQIFKDLTLDISKHQITILLGKSGCGKTTLLRILSGLEKETSGKVQYVENEHEKKPKVGMVFQESRLMPWLNVEANITLHMKNKLNSDEKSKKYLELMGLEEFAKAYPNQISGGMAQRVAIARALAYQPDVLMMDEPFSALDYFTRMSMQEELIQVYTKTKTGIIFVTHNIDEALALGHQILILRKGEPITRYDICKDHNRNMSDPFFVKAKETILKLF